MNNKLFQLLRDNQKAQARIPIKSELSEDEATIYLYDVIVSDDYWGGVAAESFVKELHSLTAPVIHLRVNSPGGDVFAARAIEAAIREHGSKVIAHIDGYAASAASYVALAADEVIMSKGSFFMIHKAWTLAFGNSDDFMETAALLDKIDEALVATYEDETKLEAAEILKMMAAETWISSEEAVEMGFADSVVESAPKNCKTWNLSVYEKAPEPEARDEPKLVESPDPEPEPEEKPEKQPETVNNREKYEQLSRLFKNYSD